MIPLRAPRFGRQARRREDRGALEFAVLVLFCVLVELVCLLAWIFG